MNYIEKGTIEFRRANIALFAGGFNTFAILYCTQPLMPELSRQFQISPVMASLSLSIATIAMACSMLFMGSLSEAWGRRSMMAFSLFASSAVTLLTSVVTDYHMLLAARIVQGIVLAGLPSIAMAYLSEEIDPTSLGVAMGLYISGNSIGGMGGRIITGTLTEWFGWRAAIFGIGLLGLIASFVFWYMLPKSRHFKPRPLEFGTLVQSLLSQCKDPRLLCLYGIGFLLMSGFVSLYNYIGYELTAPPYSLSQALVGWIFIVYLMGTVSSTWMGKMADKHGRKKVLWSSMLILLCGAGMTLHPNLIIKIAGIAVFTFGFFGGHSIASSWVGRLAARNKAQASSLYLFFYYMGSSIGGTLGGFFWSSYGWVGLVGMIALLTVLAFVVSLNLASNQNKAYARS